MRSPTHTFFNNTSNQSGYLNGLLVGAGIEHALTRNWTVKLEYDFIGFGSEAACRQPEHCLQLRRPRPVQTGTASISSTKQIVKVGVNYLFDVGGPRWFARSTEFV